MTWEGGTLIISTPGVTSPASSKTANPEALEERKLNRELASLSARAVEVFGSREKAMRWLDTPVPSLGNRTPFSLLSTEGAMAELEDTLGAIEYGIW
jgi:putative toxin-antitoxin system antitoxin component (TIGR02293 family)